MRLVFIAFSFLLPAASAFAQGSCYEPDYPDCLVSPFTFSDEVLFNSCKSELDYYREEVLDFSRCLDRWVDDTILELRREAERKLQQQADEASEEATQLQDAAVSDYQNAVSYWNCKAADPDGYCYGP